MAIDFNYEVDFRLNDEKKFSDWISRIFKKENSSFETLAYIFCDDEYLADINYQYLNHNTFTDIITFDYSKEGMISGDIFISVDRVRENANSYEVLFENELQRVMSHGVLHLLGYKDKTEADRIIMRKKEDEMMTLFHVEQSNSPLEGGKGGVK
ncbi:rRNA maturation RNase YbeY [Allomuricauda sp. d1]|uniref:rRNA maturation RNase YbeY n=1 Tax=Allomuricauda sp. d1 TaxID=3136725 RepID=UPI0031D08AE1